MNELTPQQKLQKAYVFLMNHPDYALYSGLFMLGKRDLSEKVPTAGTDGYNVMYNPAFIDALTNQELRGLVLHETMHKALKHFQMWGELRKEDADLTNEAMDHVINILIHDGDPKGSEVALPECGCFDERFRGMSTKEVFLILKKEQKGDTPVGGLDSHDWEAAEEIAGTPEGEEIAKAIDAAIRQGAMHAKLAGKGNGAGLRALEDILEAKVRWEDELLEFVSSSTNDRDMSTWKRPSRRWVHQGVYMPSTYSEVVGPLVVAIDTSGSITGKELQRFLSELVHICTIVPPEKVDLIYWGSGIAGHEEYVKDEYHKILESTKPMGGGGTTVSCVSTYLKKKGISPVAVIVLTDGELGGDWGVWDSPVLWGITTKGPIAPCGRSIYVEI